MFDQQMRLAVRAIARKLPNRRQYNIDGHKIFLEVHQKLTLLFESNNPAECFTGISVDQIIEYHKVGLDLAIENVFAGFPINDDDRVLLRQLAGLFFHRDVYSELRTGLVFAGFAETDLFPTLYTFEIDGALMGQIKKRAEAPITVNRSDVSAVISPFAQREMVDRFITGIDPEFEDAIPEYLERQIQKTGEQIIASIPSITPNLKRGLDRKLRDAVVAAVDEFKTQAMENTKVGYRKEIYDMVTFMPKQELANFAESLVNITSIKRKVSVGQETVGGPIDVAVISKSDGFVWVRRKHYFDPKFNPGFFRRKYGILSPPTEGEP